MKKARVFLCVLLVFLTLILCVKVGALSDVTDIGKRDSLKILAIGNSFSEDATEYIPMIAKDCGVKNIIVGNMYIGGCNIEKHAANARNNSASYKYYKNTSYSLMSVCPTTKDVTLETALKDEEWDVVTLQQSSPHSGLESKYTKDIDYLVDYIKSFCPNAKIGWHMTWAYQSDYTGSAFSSSYGKSQDKMYKMITNAVQNKIVNNDKFDFVIPVGTAIQNARTGYVGDKLTRDGLHLSLDYGRYIAGVTWMKTLGFSTDNLKTMPNRMRARVLPFVIECVDNALASPFEVTQSVHWYEPGTTPPATQAPASLETKVPETVPDAVESEEINGSVVVTDAVTTPETDGDAVIMPGKDNTGYVILIVCGAVAIVAAVAVVAVLRKKKK